MFGTEPVDKYWRVNRCQRLYVPQTTEKPFSASPAPIIPFFRMRLISQAIATLFLGICAHAFYLPGAAPHDYALGDQVNVLVNALTPKLLGKDDPKLVSCRNYDPL